MTCDEFKDQLVELSMGTLEASQREQVLAHLKTGCAECNSFLAETTEAVAVLPLTLDPIDPPVAARDRLMKRVANDLAKVPNPMRIGPNTPPAPRRFGIFQALAGGAIAAGIMGAIFWRTSENQRQSIAALQAQLNETRSTFDEFKLSVEAQNSQLTASLQRANDTILRTSEAVEMMRSPGIQMVSLQGTEAQPKVKARAYWNPEKSEVHFYATEVAQVPAGKTYQFWMLTDKGTALPSNTFAADQVAGPTGVAIALPTTADKVVAFAVTEEPLGGSKTPTMPIMMKGAIQ
jgi:hypothetical protein